MPPPPQHAPPALSVVVTIVDGGTALERCLAALAAQEGAGALEVLVPWDATFDPGDLPRRFPAVTFLALGPLTTRRPSSTPAGQHELFDRRRSAGLAAARGALVAIVEDRSVPRRDWAATAIALHARLPHGVIGGAIENAVDAPLNWAVYFCDFGRYQPPFAGGPRAWVSDVNVCYKRKALEQTRSVWAERYHETAVHWALRRAGEVLWLAPEMVVAQHRDGLALGALLRERVAWGRLFGFTRARGTGLLARLGYLAMTPVLPLILFGRLLRLQLPRPATLGRFLCVSPVVLLLLAAWCAGEALGYATGES
ncbi:MAG: hypothetical protein ACOY71_00045 [Gemmatimonadota bacterium]